MKQIYKVPSLCLLAAILICAAGCGGKSSRSTVELLTDGTRLAKEGKWKKAYDYAAAATKKEPGNISAQLLLALTLEKTDKLSRAREAARKAVELEPENFMARYTLGRLYAADGKTWQDAVVQLREAYRLNPRDVSVLILLADVYFNMNSADAVSCYNEIITRHPAFMANKQNAAAVWNQLAVIYARRNMDREAASCIRQAYSLDAENPHILLNFGIFWEKIKRPDRAPAYYSKYLEVTSKNPELAPKHEKVKARIAKIAGR
jgi:Flp pilus assembly protein TadD